MSEKKVEQVYSTADVECFNISFLKGKFGKPLKEVEVVFENPIQLKAGHTYYILIDIEKEKLLEVKDVTRWSYAKREKWLEKFDGGDNEHTKTR